jgi:O-acetyl-ADP-ribose deacetylase (regulator of RNase III)
VEIRYTIGDATMPDAPGNKIIVHICNDRGGWGKGFVTALSQRYLEPEAQYRRWHTGRRDNDFGLGAVQFVRVMPDLWVANLVGQHGYAWQNGQPPVRYEAIRDGLERISSFAQDHHASIHMPRIGCGLAGGEWSIVSGIVADELTGKGIAVTVYGLG